MTFRELLPTKRETGPYQGPLSTYSEYHAVLLGLVVGVASVAFGATWAVPACLAAAIGTRGVAKTNRTEALDEIRSEPWYFAGGLLVGWFALGPLL